ncbi:hypothetical protein [Tsukamurella paurometabola]|uniref:hypothetical protein n=1 Tax=Tsukamurella paurometabola TaxID=2061 RepID=UPI00019F07FC|nr:hypothetical protein [Tsukamurella paurometabola]
MATSSPLLTPGFEERGAAVLALAKTTGLSRDSGLRALYSLEDDGWITLHTPPPIRRTPRSSRSA